MRIAGQRLPAVRALVSKGRELAAPAREAVGVIGLRKYVLLARGHSKITQGRAAILDARTDAFGEEPVPRGFDVVRDVVARLVVVKPRDPVLGGRPLAFELARLPRFCHIYVASVGRCEA